MKEEIKNICFFMICGQTLLHFQSGKKYEKICRMILDLLILVGIVGIVLNLLQSVGIRKGAMTAEGNAVSNMQRSMEEALSKQLDMELDEVFSQGFSGGDSYGASGSDVQEFSVGTMEELAEKYTLEELKVRYQYLAGEYGLEMERIERSGEKIVVYVSKSDGTAEGGKAAEGGGATESDGVAESNGMAESDRMSENGMATGSSGTAEIEELEEIGEMLYFYGGKGNLDDNGDSGADIGISDIQIAEIRVEVGEDNGENEAGEAEAGAGTDIGVGTEERTDIAAVPGAFQAELAEAFMMEKDRLEVVLID